MDDNKMSEETSQSVSRRNFIKGVIAAGAVASSSAYLFRTTTLHGQPAAAGAVERLITLNVNGQDRRVDVMPQDTLAMTLRYKLGLTGTKLGCDRAECGACTVLVDDVPHYSCSVLAHTVRGKKIVTIEGLADPATGKLHAGAAGRRRRTGLPVRVLHARLRDGRDRLPEDESESDATGTGARRLRQSVPLPGLRQDPHRADARRRAHEECVDHG